MNGLWLKKHHMQTFFLNVLDKILAIFLRVN